MSVGIACLLADDVAEATRLAESLSKLNAERREIEQRMQAEALQLASAERLAEQGGALGVCLFDESWHQGVVGLVAGRIKDRLHRPVIAFARAEDGSLRGSARSIPGVHIRDALDALATRHPGLIDKFGGHAMAAGLSLKAENLLEFQSAFAQEIAARVDAESLNGVIYSDGPLSREELSVETARVLRGAGPWGQGFPEPVFDGKFRLADMRIVGERHLKMHLQHASDGPRPAGAGAIEAIAFSYVGGVAEDAQLKVGAALEIAYRLEINEYRGNERVQLNCQHFLRV
jgi:single-stranded-DNA-specific exonuclease